MRYEVSATARIPASAQVTYGIIADYRVGHPRILPPEFSGLVVEKGGVGAGTVISFHMRVMGRLHSYRAEISEPEPGRRLVEAYLEPAGTVTTFLVDPAGAGECDVTITTEMPSREGISGVVERWLSGRLLRSIFRHELQLLAAVAKG